MRLLFRFFIVFALFFYLLPRPLFAEVKEYALKNGMKVFMVEDHKSPIAVFQIWYRVGSRDEVSGRSGLSHLLEHMMFKGTRKHASKELSRTVQRHGGTDNAFTSKDYTVYFQILPSEKIGLSIAFESDRMRNLLLKKEEVASERSVVMEERRLRYEDDPQSSLYELAVASAFTVHPYRRPVIGWMDDLASIERDDLLAYYRKYYSPDNAFIVVAGDIDPEGLIKDIRKAFGKIKPGSPKESFVSQEPPQRGRRRVYLKREAELPYLLALYHVPNIPDADAYALDVLYSILSGGKSGRLYRSLVYEKKVALNAFADYSGMFVDPYLFGLGGTASPGTDISVFEEALYEEVESIKAEPPSEGEIEKSVNQIEADFIMGQDSVFYQAMLVGRFEALGDWRLKDRYIENVRKVTGEDVSRAARKHLTEKNRTVGVLIPEAPASREGKTGQAK
jgi:zinc protease